MQSMMFLTHPDLLSFGCQQGRRELIEPGGLRSRTSMREDESPARWPQTTWSLHWESTRFHNSHLSNMAWTQPCSITPSPAQDPSSPPPHSNPISQVTPLPPRYPSPRAMPPHRDRRPPRASQPLVVHEARPIWRCQSTSTPTFRRWEVMQMGCRPRGITTSLRGRRRSTLALRSKRGRPGGSLKTQVSPRRWNLHCGGTKWTVCTYKDSRASPSQSARGRHIG